MKKRILIIVLILSIGIGIYFLDKLNYKNNSNKIEVFYKKELSSVDKNTSEVKVSTTKNIDTTITTKVTTTKKVRNTTKTTTKTNTTSTTQTTTSYIVSDGEYCQDMAKEVLEYVNNARKENNLNELIWNNSLEDSAKIRAKEITIKLDHTRLDGSSCFTAINIKANIRGENIAAGQTNANRVFLSWMNSSGHRENILSDKFSEIGIACYKDLNTKYKYYWIQLFVG